MSEISHHGIDVYRDASLNVARSVSGVTQLDGLLYVVCSESDVIEVFTSGSGSPRFDRLPDITVPGMDDPNDIAACALTRHIYVADWGYHCVWKLPTSTNGTPSRWMTSVSPWALSVNEADGGRVLVTPRLVIDERPNRRGSLYAFRSDGSLADEIILPEAVSPEHAVETPRRTVIVCYTKRQTTPDGDDQRLAGICELSLSGHLIRCFEDGRKESMQWPRHVAILLPVASGDGGSTSGADNERSYRFLVADFSGGRVVQFDNRLLLERVILSAESDQVEQPRRLFCNLSDGRLILGQFNGYVGIYIITNARAVPPAD